MASTSLAVLIGDGPSVAPDTPSETDVLGETIAALAARLHAATYELLVLLREFDARAGWNTGFLSCAHWLHWRTGIDLGAAREKVRVANALAALPEISASMQRGQISYAKVRALTRVATAENEGTLLDFALAGTAAHVERLVRGWRRVDRQEDARETEMRHLNRQLAMWVDDDGMVVIRGRLSPEVGAVVQRAIEAAADRLFRDGEKSPTAGSLAEESTSGQRRADALGLLAEAALAAKFDPGTAGDRYQVVLHVSADETMPPIDCRSSRRADPASHRSGRPLTPSSGLARSPTIISASERSQRTPTPPDGKADTAFDAVIEVDDGALRISAEISRRLACDAAIVPMAHAADGTVLDVGRKTRSIPPAIGRALEARDPRCRFPGCTSRWCDAHHVVHWADGGPTSLENLVRVCRRHHRALHEGGFAVRPQARGKFTFIAPNGTPVPAVPPCRRHRSNARQGRWSRRFRSGMARP